MQNTAINPLKSQRLQLTAPRLKRKRKHELIEVLIIAGIALLCRAENFTHMAQCSHGTAHEEIYSAGKVVSCESLSPNAFTSCLRSFVVQFQLPLAGSPLPESAARPPDPDVWPQPFPRLRIQFSQVRLDGIGDLVTQPGRDALPVVRLRSNVLNQLGQPDIQCLG